MTLGGKFMYILSVFRPPCAHITIVDVEKQAEVRRNELPRYKGGMTCHQYVQHGFCNTFNTYGHCSLSHPRALHKIVSAPMRCPQCSLIWPCNHCAFTVNRDAVIATVERLEHRFRLLTQIAVEAPPIALTSHLVLHHIMLYITTDSFLSCLSHF
jgi:hypothetical protein